MWTVEGERGGRENMGGRIGDCTAEPEEKEDDKSGKAIGERTKEILIFLFTDRKKKKYARRMERGELLFGGQVV